MVWCRASTRKLCPIGCELSFPSFGRRLSRLVEVGLTQRFQNVQVPFAQLKILFSNVSEGWIGAGIGDGFRVLAKVLLPLCRGVFSAKSAGGIMPSTSVRCPRTQSGWHPPFGVGNVVAASLISSITLSTTPFEMLSANLIASFMCIVCSP
jgi:hypothetical protein